MIPPGTLTLGPGMVVGVCLGIAAVAVCVGVLAEWLGERAEKRRKAKRPGYLEVGPRGRKRLP